MDEMRDAKQGLDMKSCGRLSVPIRHDMISAYIQQQPTEYLCAIICC